MSTGFPSQRAGDAESVSMSWCRKCALWIILHRGGEKKASSWWRHQMETFSALLALCAGNSPVPVNSPHKGQWRGTLMFSLICAWINDWVNNREAGDLRRYRVHYDVTLMFLRWQDLQCDLTHVWSGHHNRQRIACLHAIDYVNISCPKCPLRWLLCRSVARTTRFKSNHVLMTNIKRGGEKLQCKMVVC